VWAWERYRTAFTNVVGSAYQGRHDPLLVGDLALTPPRHRAVTRVKRNEESIMSAMVLWIIAAVIAVVGIVVLFSGSIIWGIVLLIVAALVGPGGYSIFQRRSA